MVEVEGGGEISTGPRLEPGRDLPDFQGDKFQVPRFLAQDRLRLTDHNYSQPGFFPQPLLSKI